MKQKITKTVCNEHYLYPLNYRLPMPVNILNNISSFFQCSSDIIMRFASHPDTMALFEPSPKTLYRIQPKMAFDRRSLFALDVAPQLTEPWLIKGSMYP